MQERVLRRQEVRGVCGLVAVEDTRDGQRKSYDLTKLRFDQGVSSEVELYRSEST